MLFVEEDHVQRVVAAIVTVLAAMSAFAGGGERYAHASVIRVTSSGFTLAGQVPVLSGWSAEDGQIVPPIALRSACHVRGDYYEGRDWNPTLAAALDYGNVARSAGEHRVLLKVGGHSALLNEYVDRSDSTILNVYINLADLKPGSIAVWSFQGDHSAEGRQCRTEFGGFILSAAIKLEAGAGASSTPAP
jgi:hypothetical protein